MRLVLFSLYLLYGVAFAESPSKPLELPDFSTLENTETTKKPKVKADCGHSDSETVLPGQSGFERCMPQNTQLKQDYRGGGAGN